MKSLYSFIAESIEKEFDEVEAWIKSHNLKNLAAKLPRVPRKVTPVESDIRPTAVSLAASLKQEPSAESYGRFW